MIIEVKNVNFYYGSFRALTDITMDFEKNRVTALIGPSGCGKSTLLRLLNRMNDLIDGTRVEGESSSKGRTSTAPTWTPSISAGGSAWSSRSRTRSRNRSSTISPTVRGSPASATRIELEALVGAEPEAGRPVGRGEGHPGPIGHGALRRPAAAALHRPGARHETGRPPHGRAHIGAGPHLDGQDRGTDPGSEKALHDHHRHPQHAAGGAYLRQDGFFLHRQAHRVQRDGEDLHQSRS